MSKCKVPHKAKTCSLGLKMTYYFSILMIEFEKASLILKTERSNLSKCKVFCFIKKKIKLWTKFVLLGYIKTLKKYCRI